VSVTGPVDTLFLGSGPFAVPVLERLAGHPSTRVVGVVTAPPRPAGRDRAPRPTPAAERAGALALRVLDPPRLRDPEAVAAIAALGPGLIVLADYGRLVPEALLDLPRHGALNLHPSLLPRHRGASPVAAAILEGDRETGVTLMRMDAGLDTGPLVAQVALPLAGDELAPDLEARLAEMAADLLEATLDDWLAGRVEARPQPAEGATLTRPLRREDGRLDATRPAERLARQVRALQPWPGSWLEVEDERLVVWRAEAVTTDDAPAVAGGAAPGSLVAWADGLALVTGAGLLVLHEVQPAGRRRMGGPEYRRGRPRTLGRWSEGGAPRDGRDRPARPESP
jgi:methionyl-tRNA formyltransferase